MTLKDYILCDFMADDLVSRRYSKLIITGDSVALTLSLECNQLGWKPGDDVIITVYKDKKIVIEK